GRQYKREWSRPEEGEWRQHGGHGGHGRGRGRRGEWGGFGGPGGPGGPPPWMAGLFGMGGRGDSGRSPRVRRGDVRSAILDVLRTAAESGEQLNGYQVIQQIGERSGGAWKPSPGSVYPTIQLLHDEGLLETDDEMGRKSLRLTSLGATHVTEHADELAAVWRPFDRTDRATGEYADLKPEIGQVMGAVWQIVTQGSESQRQAAVDVLVETRRRLYGILADGDDPETGDES
ncbi:PadR family transcriptional regulator, partial [Nocardioides sp.]|uniref:PadR family transcriptional regulator n=1 Tax=Nocardioides sp. TaxID=35761 RepID=UPI0025D8EC47